ncbi:MAG: sigma 54-interacting transcriptional regulator, partial [Vicinamibacterales bacterium]|nr:sigma 54-interacting transcriptional regulator [Vicinamibacterales bacterium]
LIATGLPSVVPCAVAGVALTDESGQWTVTWQMKGHRLEVSPELIEQLEPLHRRAAQQPTLLIATREGGPSAISVPPVFEALRIRRLAVGTLASSRRQLGMLFAGREAGRPFSPGEQLALLPVAQQAAVGIENLRLNEALVRHSRSLEQQNALILAAAGEGIYGLDTDGLTTFVNPAAARLLGWSVDELLGQPMHAVLHHTHADGSAYPRETCPIYAAFKDGQVHQVRDEVFWRRDGTSFPVEYTSTPIEEEDALIGAVVVFRDVTARKDAETQLHAALGEVQSLKEQLEEENVYLQEEIRTRHNFGEIIGKSPAIGQVLQAVETVAPTNANVLIAGESGTGKELVARAVHRLSPRQDRALITVNCASIPRELFESEFFGHLKGAFTGAVRDRVGRFQLAHRGTLFLDEVGEIPLELQSKLLRVLQHGEFERVGDERTLTVDVRVIAATNRDLRHEVDAGRFREDLYYRLNVFPIEVMPLRRRPDDIAPLAAHYVEQAARRFNRPTVRLTNANIRELQTADWAGNVRELMHVIERAVLTAKGGRLRFELPGRTREPAPERKPTTREVLTDAELQRSHDDNLRAALHQTGWKIYGPGGTAELLGMKPTTLTARIKKAGLRKPDR